MWFKRKPPQPLDESEAFFSSLTSDERQVILLVQEVVQGRTTGGAFTRFSDDAIMIVELDPTRNSQKLKSLTINISSLAQKRKDGEFSDAQIKANAAFMLDGEEPA